MAHGLSCSAACGIVPDQGSNPCPLHWQADLNHCATREVLISFFFLKDKSKDNPDLPFKPIIIIIVISLCLSVYVRMIDEYRERLLTLVTWAKDYG